MFFTNTFRNAALAAVLVLPSSLLAVTPAEAARQDFTLRNRSSHTIERLYVSASTDENWGPDILGDDTTIAAGESYRVRFPNGTRGCKFDIKVVFDDGDESEKREVNLCRVRTFTVND
jgi:hypothetical protein